MLNVTLRSDHLMPARSQGRSNKLAVRLLEKPPAQVLSKVALPSLRLVVGVATASGLLFALTAGGSLTTTDAVLAFDLSQQILDGDIALSPAMSARSAFAVTGVDGRLYSPWGIGQSLFGAPFVQIGLWVGALPAFRALAPEVLPKAMFALSSVVAAALAVVLCFGFAYATSRSASRALMAGAVLAVATPLWPYSGFGFNTALASAALILAVGAAWKADHDGRDASFFAAGLSIGLASSVRHEFFLLIPVVAFWWATTHVPWPARLRRVGWAAAGIAPIAIGIGAYNYLRFGSPLGTGHAPAFDMTGFAGLLLSPSASVLLYCPAVVVMIAALFRLPPEHQRLRQLMLLTVVVMFVFYGTMENWMGGRSYGPRYLVPLLALLCVPLAIWGCRAAVRRLGTMAALAILALSAIVQVPGVVINYAAAYDAWALEHPGSLSVGERTWDLSGSALVVTSSALFSPASPAAIVPGPIPGRSGSRIDFWWLHLTAIGIVPAALAWSFGAIILLGFVAALIWNGREARLWLSREEDS